LPPDFVENVAHLRSAQLAAVQFANNDKFDFESHGAAWSLEVDDEEIYVAETSSTARISVTVRWDAVEDLPFEEPFGLSVAVEGCFDWSEDFDEDYRRGWTAFNGVYLLWPYLRSYISMITGAAGLPPFYLPTLTVPVSASRPGETTEFDAARVSDDPDMAAG
jgi:preprotein translocase subunit SecB